MAGHLIQHLLVFILVYADFAYSHSDYYITPSLNESVCPQQPCLSLSQLTANSSRYLGNETNITLFFLPGIHNLNEELSLSHADNFSMTKDKGGNGTVFIECGSPSGRFNISEMTSVTIKNLHFIGCGSNGVSQVEKLIVKDTIFQGVEGKGTEIVLSNVTTARIAGSIFHSNTYVNNCNTGVLLFGSTILVGGRALYIVSSNVSIISCKFMNNTVNADIAHTLLNFVSGGALYTTLSNVLIVNSTFTNNRAGIGGALFAHSSNLHVVGSNYSYNTAANYGGVMGISESTVNITNSNFSNNAAEDSGGVMLAYYNNSFSISGTTFTNNSAGYDSGVMETYSSSFIITDSTFSDNAARKGHGGVMYTRESSFVITDSSFSDNAANLYGGVMSTNYDSFSISGTTFANNSAGYYGGVMYTSSSSFTITDSTFSDNAANWYGGVMYTRESSFVITDSTFSDNAANSYGGVMSTNYNDSFNISGTTFANNSAGNRGGVINTYISSFIITDSTFSDNAANSYGGVMYTSSSSFIITDSTFSDNAANSYGGAIFALYSLFSIDGNNFTNNSATIGGVILLGYGDPATTKSIDITNSTFINNSGGGFIVCFQSSTHIANSEFDHNSGSLYIFNGNLTFSGYTVFENSAEPSNKVHSLLQERGGAVTSFLSTVTFTGESILSNNHAQHGGAILAVESTIIMYGSTTIANNMATKYVTNSSGGGISLRQSKLEIKGKCNISDNHAIRGGGIHASGSTIAIYQPGTLHLINNRAENGGGLYLEVNPKVYIQYYISDEGIIIFRDNHAIYGGAVYVADNTSSSACLANSECFIQTLILDGLNGMQNTAMYFSDNTASQGINIFGGLLDRCIPNAGPLAEVYLMHDSGDNYLDIISKITSLDTISSLPVRVCFCNNESEPDCSYQPPIINVKKEHALSVSLVAMDQVYNPVNANISSFLSSQDGGFSEGQQT